MIIQVETVFAFMINIMVWRDLFFIKMLPSVMYALLNIICMFLMLLMLM